MQYRLVVLFLIPFLILTFSGCGIVQEIKDQVSIANTFADFATSFSGALSGENDFPQKAKDTLASSVSMEMNVGNEDVNTTIFGLDNNETPLSISFKIENVPRDDFITFLTAIHSDEVPEDLRDAWEEYNYLRSQNLENIIISANDTTFDEDTSFDTDTIRAIRAMIDVGKNTATLQVSVQMDINEIAYSGPLKIDLIKNGDEWKISNLELDLTT